MAKSKRPQSSRLTVDAFKHEEATRTNIPTAEYQSVMREDEKRPIPVTYRRGRSDADEAGGDPLSEEKARRNRDLDPQLVWRGKDQQDWSDLVVHAPPLYIQEKVHPKALIDDLRRWSERQAAKGDGAEGDALGHQFDLFADFNGIPDEADKTDFYRHEGHWSNRMILGDSLQVMASLAEREGLRGKVQCIYLDPPYGIKFNSNFQWSTTSRDVKDGNPDHITREPEQVKAFRDTWRDGIHSYLTYLRDRFTVARDLLTESGSIFVQIGDENVHRVRAVMDEVFGIESSISTIVFAKTSSSTGDFLGPTFDTLLWYAKRRDAVKYRKYLLKKTAGQKGGTGYKSVQLPDLSRRSMAKTEVEDPGLLPIGAKIYFRDNLTSQSIGREKGDGAASWFGVRFEGKIIKPSASVRWKTNEMGFDRLLKGNRVDSSSGSNLGYIRFLEDYPVYELADIWSDTLGQNQFGGPKTYVVQTALTAVERCILMSTDPGDLILDPTCGSGTTAYVAEQWGRRWITIDTSRVALALARARIMGARYPYYLLADSEAGRRKEAEVTRTEPSSQSTHGNINHGFVYERVPHITLKSIANNAEIDVIWEQWQETLEPLRTQINQILVGWVERSETHHSAAEGGDGFRSRSTHPTPALDPLEEWEIPREADPDWPTEAADLLSQWWEARIARQREIDASIAAKADFEYLYDKPYEDRKTVRVAGPFTVETLSPHRVLGLDENDDLIDPIAEPKDGYGGERDFVAIILDNLKTAGVQQAHKEDRIDFTALTPWPGEFICAEGCFSGDQWPLDAGAAQAEEGAEKRAAILIGPEFGTVSRLDLVEAAREAGDAGFDLLIACAFNYDAHSSEFAKLGRIPVLKARMNADLHMAEDLKNTGKGNLFVIFGEPDIEIQEAEAGQIRVKVNGVDVFHPSTGEVRGDGAEGIACWLIDTDYNQEAFFVRHAYFLGANDPYKALKTTLKAEIDPDAWSSLNSDTSRPFRKPLSRRIAVKVINHLGDEVMKVFRV